MNPQGDGTGPHGGASLRSNAPILVLNRRRCTTTQQHRYVGTERQFHSRPYRKNDQAWIEQKNGAVVRHFVGHDRYSGSVAGQTMAHLYGAVRRYVNYFQPSFKLVEKTRHGSRVVKRYSPPATPCDRLMQHDAVSVEMKAALSEYRVQLDPVALLYAIRTCLRSLE